MKNRTKKILILSLVIAMLASVASFAAIPIIDNSENQSRFGATAIDCNNTNTGIVTKRKIATYNYYTVKVDTVNRLDLLPKVYFIAKRTSTYTTVSASTIGFIQGIGNLSTAYKAGTNTTNVFYTLYGRVADNYVDGFRIYGINISGIWRP